MKVTIFEGTPDEVIEVLRNLPNSSEHGNIKITTLAGEDITDGEPIDPETGKPKPTPPTKPPTE